MNNYYTQEDTPPDTDESARALWKQQSAQLAPVAEHTQSALDDIGSTLNQLHQAANGDEQVGQQLGLVWNRSNELAQNVQRLDSLRAASEAVMFKLDEQRNKVLAELKDLTDAIANRDGEHPKLEDFVRDIEELTEEYVNDMTMMYADEQAWDTLYEEVIDNLALYGIDTDSAYKVFEALCGNVTFDETQIALLRQFAASLTPHRAIVLMADDPEDFDDDDTE